VNELQEVIDFVSAMKRSMEGLNPPDPSWKIVIAHREGYIAACDGVIDIVRQKMKYLAERNARENGQS
jgi:hypothetical protein